MTHRPLPALALLVFAMNGCSDTGASSNAGGSAAGGGAVAGTTPGAAGNGPGAGTGPEAGGEAGMPAAGVTAGMVQAASGEGATAGVAPTGGTQGGAGTGPVAGAQGSAGTAPVAGDSGAAGTQPSAGDQAPAGVAPMAGAGGGETIAADAPAPDDVSPWAEPGPYGSRVVENSGPDGQFTLFVPEPLAQDGVLNPIVTWGNGSLTRPSSYRSLLSHYASHGLFVVASNDTNVGSGRQMIAGMRWAIEESARMGSPYFGKLDPDAVASIGYSQGGIGAVITGNEPEVTTTIPIAGGDETVKNIEHPIFLIGNENDTAAPVDVIAPQFTVNETATFVFGVLLDTGHLETLGDGGRHRGYTTAWMAYHLLEDREAYRVFFGDDQCTLCVDPQWETQRKNLP